MIGRTNCTQKGGSPSEFVNIQMLTNQAEHSNLNGAVLTMSYETYSKQYTWDGSEITFSVPAHVSCTIEFPEVEGYKKPDNITFVAVEGNSRTIEAEYKAELVKVNVTSSNGSAVSGAKITIAGKQQTWNGTEIRQLVPFGTQYSVVAGAVSGFGTPSTQTFTAQNPEREVSVVYIASSLKVNILSNQGTDAAITNVKATVKYGSTSVQVANGGTVNIPSGTSGTITFPDVEGYKKPSDISFTHNGGVTEKTGTYYCELLTVNVGADSGSVSGFEVTISKQETVGVATKYTKLEYIESTGTQYIDTGITPSVNLKAQMKFVYTTAGGHGIYGVCMDRTGNDSTDYRLFSTGGNLYLDIMASRISKPYTTGVVNEYEIGNNYVKDLVSGSSIMSGSAVSSITTGKNIYIFNDCGNDAGRIYYLKMYNDNTLVRDFTPALRSDGIAGLYDAVNDVFYPSNSSANFIAGSKNEETIATQTSVTGTYKIPFETSYIIQANSIDGYKTPATINRIAVQSSYIAELQYKVITDIDLSLQDIYGNETPQSTANCYVIREKGQYKFPLVFGNAIKDGAVNTAAFTNIGGNYTHNFVDAKGNAITSPYVPAYESAPSLIVKNKDTEGLISNLVLHEENGVYYAKFKIDSIPQSGANIIISAEQSWGSSWSWHLWLWPHDLSPVEITNATGVKYKIMPVNLASKYDDDMIHVKSWFYQWGRKDPMLLPKTWNSTSDPSVGSWSGAGNTNVSEAIKMPTTFFYAYWLLYATNHYNLWDASSNNSGASDKDTVKTVYDPCPVGWKVPNGKTFTGLSVISNTNGIVKMRRYSGDTVGVEFPLSGCRYYYKGYLQYVGSSGYVWTSACYSAEYAIGIEFNTGTSVNSHYTVNDDFGFPIRPVQE